MVHAPLQYRLISGSSINCEDEERIFNSLKGIVKSCSNNKPGQVIGTMITRFEVENLCKEKYDYVLQKSKVENEIRKIGQILYEKEHNSFFSYEFISEHPKEWQSHLERLSDYLI